MMYHINGPKDYEVVVTSGPKTMHHHMPQLALVLGKISQSDQMSHLNTALKNVAQGRNIKERQM
jgi:hypothetical protein